MPLTESQAQQITLIRVLEQTRNNGGLWSAGDAKEATRAATELVGHKAPFDQFLARRACWSLEEIQKRLENPIIDLLVPRWVAVVGWLIVVIAMLVGFLTDHLATDRRVNIVEYPLVGLMVWNLTIFSGIFLRWLTGLLSPRSKHSSFLADIIGRWRLQGAFSGHSETFASWITQFKKDWYFFSSCLNQARLEFVFHAAAMFFAIGALASLYVRGYFKEYRAGWESTFFSADSIHAICPSKNSTNCCSTPWRNVSSRLIGSA